MRDKDGKHLWGTHFDKHESETQIGSWYWNGKYKKFARDK